MVIENDEEIKDFVYITFGDLLRKVEKNEKEELVNQLEKEREECRCG